jgi:dsRNA-specific ribonuclease
VISILNEWKQKGVLTTLNFEDKARQGPDHLPTFVVVATATKKGGIPFSEEGKGSTKQKAKEDAADKVYRKLSQK